MTGQKMTLEIPLNRVEGDLDIRVEIEDGVVRDAWASATLFRGIERLLLGRAALDGLIITPRICGICSTAHLTAAAGALEQIALAEPPPAAVKVRNIALMAELVQSDVRQSFLTFASDFASPAYAGRPLHEEAVRRWAPFAGETAREVIRETKKLLEVVAILGGGWPHPSFIVPGGITSLPGHSDRAQADLLVRGFRRWYERRVLGGPVEEWLAIGTAADIDRWLDTEAHRTSDLGFFLRFAREAGLDRMGRGYAHYLSAGALPLPEGASASGGGTLIPAGFMRAGQKEDFAPAQITECTAAAWYQGSSAPQPPAVGQTEPYASGHQADRYSWAKAARYAGLPAETGPLAEAIIAGHPLLTALTREGPSAFTRQLARIVRPAALLPVMETWLEDVGEDNYYTWPGEIEDGEGYGLIEATRGALGHFLRVEGGVIRHYQVITPTTWHASPRDERGQRGPIEEALVGTEVHDPERPVEVGHVVRSFDPCLGCTVHAIGPSGPLGRLRLGAR